MNRLVARVIRNGLARRGRLTAAYEAAAFVLDVYSRALVGSPDRRAVRGILQQVTALLDSLAGPATEINEELAWVLLRLRFVAFYHALELGDSTPLAIAVGEPLAEDLGRLLGPEHPDTLNSRNSLAAAYLAAGRVDEAIPLFEQILAVRQRMLGPDDSETLVSQNNLASAYQDAGRIAEAIRLYELNLEVRERLLGSDHPSTLNSRGNLAAAYRDGGRVDEAIPLLEQTLADRERVLGPEHPDTQATRRKLATAYQDAGRAAEAVPLLERASADRKPVLRSDHPIPRPAPKNLAKADRAPDRVADAIPPPEQTLVARKQQPADAAAGQMPPAGFRRPPAASGQTGASGRLPPASRRLGQAAASRRCRTPAGQADRPFIHQPDGETATQRRRVRPRGCRGDHGGRPGGHRHGVRQVRAGPVRLLPLDPSRFGGRGRGLEGHIRHRRCHAQQSVRAFRRCVRGCSHWPGTNADAESGPRPRSATGRPMRPASRPMRPMSCLSGEPDDATVRVPGGRPAG